MRTHPLELLLISHLEKILRSLLGQQNLDGCEAVPVFILVSLTLQIVVSLLQDSMTANYTGEG